MVICFFCAHMIACRRGFGPFFRSVAFASNISSSHKLISLCWLFSGVSVFVIIVFRGVYRCDVVFGCVETQAITCMCVLVVVSYFLAAKNTFLLNLELGDVKIVSYLYFDVRYARISRISVCTYLKNSGALLSKCVIIGSMIPHVFMCFCLRLFLCESAHY